MPSYISPHAIVEKGAEIAPDVRIGAFSYIGAKVKIAPGCIISNNVTIIGKTTVGEKTSIYPMAVIGAAPDNSGKAGECIIGKANALREHVTIYAGLRKPTQIGTDNLIMISCQVGAGCVIGDHGIFANCTQIGAGAIVEDYVRASGFTHIEGGVTVGAYTFTAGFAGVHQDAPPFAILQGFPYRVRGVNTENLRRCGFDDEDIRALRSAFRELFNGTGCAADEDAIKRMLGQKDLNPQVRRAINAIRSAKPAPGDQANG